MFDFLKRNAISSDLSQIRSKHIAGLLKKDGQEKALVILKRAAIAGSTDSAVFLSVRYGQIIDTLKHDTPKVDVDNFLYFTKMAAERGHSGSQLSLAKYYLHELKADSGELGMEDYGNLKKAEYWCNISAAKGVLLSAKSLEDVTRIREWSRITATKTVAHRDEEAGFLFLKKSIAQKGWAGTITVAMMMVVACMPTREIAYQFFLGELDAASQGNEASQKAVRRSGIPAQEYRGAFERALPAVNGPGGPLQLLMRLSSQFASEPELMARFRCDVGRAVQEYFHLGSWATD